MHYHLPRPEESASNTRPLGQTSEGPSKWWCNWIKHVWPLISHLFLLDSNQNHTKMPLNYENILFFIIVLNFSTQNGVGYKLWNHNIIAAQNIFANKSICKIMCLGCSPLLFNSGLILSIVRLKTHVQTACEPYDLNIVFHSFDNGFKQLASFIYGRIAIFNHLPHRDTF